MLNRCIAENILVAQGVVQNYDRAGENQDVLLKFFKSFHFLTKLFMLIYLLLS
jgi:hypothetical protein